MNNLDFNKNDDKIRLLISEMKRKHSILSLGGGKEKIEKQHKKGKLTARERINYLKDPNSKFLEIGSFAGHEMYEEYGGANCAGVVAGVGRISNHDVMIIANDATVKAGAYFEITLKKTLRMQEIAYDNNLPVVYLVDSAGVFLPLQDQVFPDE